MSALYYIGPVIVVLAIVLFIAIPRLPLAIGVDQYHVTPVKEFHEAFGHPIKCRPAVPPIEHRLLRVKLLAEELAEFADASGIQLEIDTARRDANDEAFVMVREIVGAAPNIVEAADALGDIRYVVDGSNLVWGFPGEIVLDEIHHSNMSKLGADGKPVLRQDGKVLKGPGYFKPKIALVIARAMRGMP